MKFSAFYNTRVPQHTAKLFKITIPGNGELHTQLSNDDDRKLYAYSKQSFKILSSVADINTDVQINTTLVLVEVINSKNAQTSHQIKVESISSSLYITAFVK
jgi:hypothetical protein